MLLERIKTEIRPIAGGTLEVYGHECGYKPSTAARKLRELVNESKILPSYSEGYVQYRFNPPTERKNFEPGLVPVPQGAFKKAEPGRDNTRGLRFMANLVSGQQTIF